MRVAAFLFALSLAAGLPAPASADKPFGTSRQARDAEQWLKANAGRFALSFGNGLDSSYVYTTDKKYKKRTPEETIFLITYDDAGSLLQTIVDCGLWQRYPELEPHLAPARWAVGLESREPDKESALPHAGSWKFTGPDDNVSTLFIVRRMREITPADHRPAFDRMVAGKTK